MKRLLLIAGLAVLVIGKPEKYKETEDFQYARSSTDEGSKSGYYGAQRGNMGGNYEKAHNMDMLAQNQMSGLMRSVHGDLGEGINTRKGNVFGAASSRGIYGQGHYDLSNLGGRNFEEGATFEASQGLSSSQSGYNRQSSASRRSGEDSASYSQYGAAGSASNSNYQRGYSKSSGYKSGYNSQSGYSSQNEDKRIAGNYENAYDDESQRRLVHYSPLKVILRPGSRIDLPLTAQASDVDKVEVFDENSINHDTKEIEGSDYNNNKAKHYQSSFSYRKQWEKHDENPKVAPLSIHTGEENSYDSNRDTSSHHLNQYSNSRYNQGSRYMAGQTESQNLNSGYNQGYRKSSSSSQHDEYGSNQRASSSFGASSDYQQNSNAYKNMENTQNHLKLTDKAPKKYESSYSYHKSWERQGDPYVIIPASDGASAHEVSQRLSDASSKHRSYSHEYGSQQFKHSHQAYSGSQTADC